MRELVFIRSGRLQWREREPPTLVQPTDAIVRPLLASRCDGDTLPIHRPVSRALQVGIAARVVDPVVRCVCGRVPFAGPLAIGHECVAEVLAAGDEVRDVRVGERVVVPWAVSCGSCGACRRGLTSKCETTTRGRVLAAYGFGDAAGGWGGMVCERLRVPFADHMLVRVPAGVPLARVAAAGDNLADGWRAVVPPLMARPGAAILVLGGGAKSIGLYAAGLAAAAGAQHVDYVDPDPGRRAIAESFGARATRPDWRAAAGRRHRCAAYDVVVEATSRASGLRTAIRALAPGGVCTAVGYYLAAGTRLPLMRMYATDGTLRIGVSHARAILPELLSFLSETRFEAERVTTLTAAWEEAPTAYAARTTKVVLARDPVS